MHGVKGLEFKCVFIVGLEDGIFPIRRFDSLDDELEEERRIMYVAITRAKERLYLTHAQQRYRFGTKSFTTPSLFLKESGVMRARGEEILKTTKPVSTYNFKTTFAQKPTPSFAKPSPMPTVQDKDLSKFKVGQMVSHTKFGKGEIIAISGENADIKFEVLGVKKFNMRLAPISIIE